LDANLVRAGDQLAFTFKKHRFTGVISAGALIAQCTWNGKPIHQSGFKTLTDWCDTCIQELVHEYVTRFSSWKRVRHVPTQRSFTQLREALPRIGLAPPTCTCAETRVQQRHIARLEQRIMQLQAQMKSTKAQPPVEDDNPFKLVFDYK
jgi:hypothetical protein